MKNPLPEWRDTLVRMSEDPKLRAGLKKAGEFGASGVKAGFEGGQKLIQRYGLRLLIAACPLLPTDQAPMHDGIEIVDEANRPDTIFLKQLSEAKNEIRHDLSKDNSLRVEQRAILEEALAYPENEVLALAIKESRLNPKEKNGGYLQLTQSAVDDLERVFPRGTFAVDTSPEKNIEQGLTYLALIQGKYIAPHELAKDMSEEDQRALAHFFYNMGPTAGVRLWEETGAKNLKDFEAGIVEILGNRMSLLNRMGVDFVGPSATKKVEDPNYHVPYVQSGAECIYLEKVGGGKTEFDTILKEAFFPDQKYPTVEKVIISLRYLHLTEAIAKELKDPESRKNYMEAMFGEAETAPEKTVYIQRTLKKGEYLWTLSQEFGVSVDYLKKLNGLSSDDVSAGQTLKVPQVSAKAIPYLYLSWIQVTEGKGFYTTLVENPDYNAYLAKSVPIEKEDIEEVVFMFNKTFNPEFASVADTTVIPVGALIWIPNVQYFIDYFKDTVGKKDTPQEDPDDESEGGSSGSGSTPSGPLNSRSAGQYVKKVGGRWVLDTEATREGAERFPKKTFGDHPAWSVAGDLKRKRFGGKDGLNDVRWIVLHSTISGDTRATENRELAHFAVERDGDIRYIVSVNKADPANQKIPPHAGRSCWDGVQDLNRHAVGIEVVANAGQNWSTAQYDSVEDLVGWIGGYYGLEQRDVLTHKQIAADGRYGRGRKSDPYADNSAQFWANLDLPDNSGLLDLCVARGTTKANISAIKSDKNHKGVWSGLQAAETNF